MKRDMDLIREILLTVEAHEDGFAPRTLTINGYTEGQIGYHCYLLGEADLATVADTTTRGSDGPEAVVTSLTWKGHEFLDAAREPSRWDEAHAIVNKLGGASFQIWLSILTDLVKQNIGITAP